MTKRLYRMTENNEHSSRLMIFKKCIIFVDTFPQEKSHNMKYGNFQERKYIDDLPVTKNQLT